MMGLCSICNELVDADGHDPAKHGVALCDQCDPPFDPATRTMYAFAIACRDNPAILKAARGAYRLGGLEAVANYRREVLATRHDIAPKEAR